MNCPHASPLSNHVNSCGLGLHGGRPSKGTCAGCMARGENNAEFAASYKPPTLPEMARSLAGSVAGWAKSGFQVTDEVMLASRLEICRGCEFWDASGFAGTGRCQKCGCSTQAKLRMATASCPLNPPKWGPAVIFY